MTSSPSLCSWSGSWESNRAPNLPEPAFQTNLLAGRTAHVSSTWAYTSMVGVHSVKYLPKRPISIKPNGSDQYSQESLLAKRRPFLNDAAWNGKGLHTYRTTIYFLLSYSLPSSHFGTFSFQRRGHINRNQETSEKLVTENVGAQLALKNGERAWC